MNNYLITGAAGFIGSNFVKYMIKHHPECKLILLDALTYAGNYENIAKDIDNKQVVFIKGDIGDAPLVRSLFSQYDLSVVVNFAAESHVDRSIENPQLFLTTNILGTQTLLEEARKAWTMEGKKPMRQDVRFHQVSTDEVYGSLETYGFFTEKSPLAPSSPYSASKTSADLIVCAYAKTFGLPISITRCSNNYGPYQFPEKLIPLMINNILKNKPLPIYGDGQNIRDWLYVDDHCEAIDLVIRKGESSSIYNVGGHNEYSNLDLVKIIIRTIRTIMEQEPEYHSAFKLKDKIEIQSAINKIDDNLITFVNNRLGHDLRYAIDPKKISEDLNWSPTVMFKEGIDKTIRWYLKNIDWVEHIVEGEYKEYYKQMYENR